MLIAIFFMTLISKSFLSLVLLVVFSICVLAVTVCKRCGYELGEADVECSHCQTAVIRNNDSVQPEERKVMSACL